MIENGQKFRVAQTARRKLIRAGFTSLCKIENAEHWVNGPVRVALVYDGAYPEKVPATINTFGLSIR